MRLTCSAILILILEWLRQQYRARVQETRESVLNVKARWVGKISIFEVLHIFHEISETFQAPILKISFEYCIIQILV